MYTASSYHINPSLTVKTLGVLAEGKESYGNNVESSGKQVGLVNNLPFFPSYLPWPLH